VPDVSAVFVNHLSAAECAAAVASFRAALTRGGLSGEAIAVDCGSGPAEAARLELCGADRLVLLPDNRGYSGGLNAGIAAASSSRLLLCNADVELDPDALGPLLEAVEAGGVGAAAPVQFADREATIRLPSGFGSGFFRDLRQLRGRSGSRSERRRFASWARRQWRAWREGGAFPHLTGSILATRRDVLDAAGRFDETLPFEYEETEWEDRVTARGLELVVAARARAFHFHGTSSGRSPEAAGRALASRRRYRRKRYGRLGDAMLALAEASPGYRGLRDFPGREVPARGAEFALAASPNPSVLPFAAISLDRPVPLAKLFSALAPRLAVRVFRVSDGAPEEAFWGRA
jgi:GT2 family glycosyltransferase